MRRRTAEGGRQSRTACMLVGAILAAACGERRDVADLAVGVAPFEELRGTNAAALRSGGLRAFRRAAEPSPYEGLREPIGAFDVVYSIPGFDGSDGSWPNEDALVAAIEATREWPSDSAASAAYAAAVRVLQDGLGVGPLCLEVRGPGFSLQMAQWDRGDGWAVTASLAPSVRVSGDTTLSARHSIAVRRAAITALLPQDGAPNPDERPTWTPSTCDTE